MLDSFSFEAFLFIVDYFSLGSTFSPRLFVRDGLKKSRQPTQFSQFGLSYATRLLAVLQNFIFAWEL